MQSVTSLFNTIWSGSHRAVVKAVINDSITIGEDIITNLKTDGALFSENDFSFGGCISRQFEMSFYPGNITIPRMAKVQLYMQLTNGTQTSEWISKGIFYIDTRETDINGLMKITGYDAMLKTEQDFIPTSTPQSMQATASQIATAIGVSLDGRCVFQNYNCQLVTGYSMREILGFIAGVHGGNWIITDTGNLRLVRTSSSVDSFTITNSELMSYNKGSTYASVTKVIIHIDDETYVEAGNTTGRTIEVTCPWATTAMAQALLTQLGSVSYTPCTASVLLHPAAEIGDKFVVSSISHSIATQTIHFNSLFLSELEVPGEEEIDHEYPYKTSSELLEERAVKTTSKYNGVSINRTDGIRVQKYDGDDIVAQAVFNAEELSFYDEAGDKVLYFDAVGNRYVFTGTISAGIMESPYIYSGTESDAEFLTKMTSDGFEIYKNETPLPTNSKVRLYSGDEIIGTSRLPYACAGLILGEGSTQGEYYHRFIIEKNGVNARICYMSGDGTPMGIQFDQYGCISFVSSEIGKTHTYTVESSEWGTVSDVSPFTHAAEIACDESISDDTTVTLYNNNAVDFANHRFAIADASEHSITIYSVGVPAHTMEFEVNILG